MAGEIEIRAPQQIEKAKEELFNENAEKARDILLPFAETGMVEAQLYLAKSYEVLEYDTANFPNAVYWYERALEQECSEAAYDLGLLLRSLQDGKAQAARIRHLFGLAFAEFERRAQEEHDTRAQYLYAEMLWEGHGTKQNRKKAVEWYRLAAEAGDPSYQFILAQVLWHAPATYRDRAEAIMWIIRAAEQGHPDAAYMLGALYATADEVDLDAQEAARWYWKAAEGGNSEAKYNLGLMYCRGEGASKDEALGRSLIAEAAHDGDILAIDLMADARAEGALGFPKDEEKGRYWRARHLSATEGI